MGGSIKLIVVKPTVRCGCFAAFSLLGDAKILDACNFTILNE